MNKVVSEKGKLFLFVVLILLPTFSVWGRIFPINESDSTLNSCLNPILLPDSASKGQYVDHIYTYNHSVNQYTFPMYLQKFHKYQFHINPVSTCITLSADVIVIGDDWDGINGQDIFKLGWSLLGDGNDKLHEVDYFFGPARTGNYQITVIGNVSISDLAVNVYIKLSDLGDFSKRGLLYELDPYHNSMTRKYYVSLEDDTTYGIKLARTQTYTNDPQKYYSEVSVVVKCMQDLSEFRLLMNQPFEYAFESANTYQTFAMSYPGLYEITITVNLGPEVSVCNVVTFLYEEGKVGDGPEITEINEEQGYGAFNFDDLFNSGMIYIIVFLGSIGFIVTIMIKPYLKNGIKQR
jgi:hypothetical protein